MVDTNAIKQIVGEILQQEQRNSQTLTVLSAKIKDQSIAQQLREMANTELQAANKLAEITYLITNESTYAGTGLQSRSSDLFPGDGKTLLYGGDYTEVLTDYDGSGPAVCGP